MAKVKVWIEDGCIACGVCESICSDVFEVKETSEVIPGVVIDEYLEEKIDEAAENCPVSVIKVKKS